MWKAFWRSFHQGTQGCKGDSNPWIFQAANAAAWFYPKIFHHIGTVHVGAFCLTTGVQNLAASRLLSNTSCTESHTPNFFCSSAFVVLLVGIGHLVERLVHQIVLTHLKCETDPCQCQSVCKTLCFKSRCQKASNVERPCKTQLGHKAGWIPHSKLAGKIQKLQVAKISLNDVYTVIYIYENLYLYPCIDNIYIYVNVYTYIIYLYVDTLSDFDTKSWTPRSPSRLREP